jgi:hypothetical protein
VGLSVAAFATGALWSREEKAPLPPAQVEVVTMTPATPQTPAPVEVVATTPAPSLPVAELKLVGLPAGVTVTIDGRPVKDPGAELYLEAGSHQVVVTAGGFAGSATVELTAGERRTLQMVMARQPSPKGSVEVLCQPWCEIEVNGHKTGRLSPATLDLSPGLHRLRCVNPALGIAKDQDVLVEVGTSRRVVVNLKE